MIPFPAQMYEQIRETMIRGNLHEFYIPNNRPKALPCGSVQRHGYDREKYLPRNEKDIKK